jgi:hypothetical protein
MMSAFIAGAKFSYELGGALLTLTGLNRAAPIVHTAIDCAPIEH